MAEKWGAEAPQITRKYDWYGIAARLRRRPGQWLLVGEQYNRALAGAIRRGHMRAFNDPAWEYEVKTRNTKGNLADIWMTARERTGNGTP